jgi:sec-independent protein translocase protein TatB
MFDIGFSELMVVAIVALIVIGPEKLPRVARTVGHLAGRLQRYVSDVKADINREMELDELRKFKDEFQQAAQSVQAAQTDLAAEMNKVEDSFRSIVNDASSGLATPAPEPAPALDAPAPEVADGEESVPQSLAAGRKLP